MKKILSALIASVFTAAFAASDLGRVSADIYNNAPINDKEYYCIVKFADDPLSKYEYAKQYGVNEFILTDDGKKAYENLMEYHDNVKLVLDMLLERNIEKVYDYTAVYNGFSVILSNSEYKTVSDIKEEMGIADIYELEPCDDDKNGGSYSAKAANVTYADITDKIFEQTGAANVDLKGDTTVISVIDGGFESDHEFLSTMPDGIEGRLDENDVSEVSPFLSATSGNGSNYYQNDKIPFRFNYYSHGNNTSEVHESALIHGTHVAGIAGGNGAAETDDTYDPKGIAPQAQLLLMATNMRKECIMAAYDDSAYLGADIVNISYGNDYLPTALEPFTEEALLNLSSTGTMLCAAAGNSSKIRFSGSGSLLNMDYSAGGTPDGIPSVFTVGSAENIVSEKNVLTAGDENYIIMSTGTYDISETFADRTMDIVAVPGMGYPEDYNEIDVNGKIAVVKRGEISFDEKAFYAQLRGAEGIIFYNNVNEELSNNIVCTILPCCILSLNDGESLINSAQTKVTFNSEKKLITNAHNTISDFSTWGFTENLVLKPDITAYGGNIVSSMPDGKYGVQSGTSMASPQMAGMAALLKEYLKNNKEKYGIENDSDYPELMARLLMSTAEPVYNTSGSALASPRVQGSGLANVEKAINTPSYLYTDSQEDNFRPKLSLGDRLETKSGNIEFCIEKFHFHIKNVSDKEQTYRLSADIMRDDAQDETLVFDSVPMKESSIKFFTGMTEISTITVDPGEDAVVNALLDLNVDDINTISSLFPNGTFIDGFIHLKSDSAPELTLPFMGYFDSWNKGDIFEPFAYDSRTEPSLNFSALGDCNGNFAGINMIKKQTAGKIQSTMPYYSPNGDNILDDFSVMIAFKRRCKNVKAQIFQGSKTVYSEELSPDMGFVNMDTGYVLYKLDWSLEGAEDGDIYDIRITAEKPFSENGSDKDIISQQFAIDITAPVVKDCRELDINGEKYMLINSSDNKGIQGAIMNDDFDYNYCEKDNAAEYYAVLKLPDDSSDACAVVYDTAGNSTKVTADDMTEDKYTLTYDDNLYFSTNDATFKDKILLKDSNGKKVNYTMTLYPKDAYKKGLTQVPLLLNYSKIADIPVSVGLAGDVDQNDAIDLQDAVLIAKYILWESNPNGAFKDEFKDFKGSFSEYLADYDKSGHIDLHDAVCIAKLILSNM